MVLMCSFWVGIGSPNRGTGEGSQGVSAEYSRHVIVSSENKDQVGKVIW